MADKLKALNPRAAAFSVLLPFERLAFKGSESLGENRLKLDQSLDSILKDFPEQERKFINALSYGTVRHWFRLNAVMAWGLSSFADNARSLSQGKIKQALKSLDVKVRLVLRLGLAQLFVLDSVPDYAAITTSLSFADELKLKANDKKRLHAILSAAAELKSQAEFDFNALGKIWPASFIESLAPAFSSEEIAGMMFACGQAPSGFWIRVNQLKTTIEDYKALLTDNGIAFNQSEQLPEMFWVSSSQGPLTQLPKFHEGLLYIQDISSATVTEWLSPLPGETVLDLCAAPGSKTSHIAARMKNQGRIVAVELQEKRAKRLEENCDWLGVQNTKVITADAFSWEPKASESFDRILVDAPCSGIGTVRHQPDVLLQWRTDARKGFSDNQLALLCRATSWLKKGGVMLYSTCSLDPLENDYVIEAFMAEFPDWQIVKQYRNLITPTQDGFYGALLKKPET